MREPDEGPWEREGRTFAGRCRLVLDVHGKTVAGILAALATIWAAFRYLVL